MSSSAGFTLLETLVALSITGMLALGGTTLLVQSTRAGAKVTETTDLARRLDLAHTLVRDDLANATLRISRAPNETDLPRSFHGTDKTTGELLSFTRSGWIGDGQTELRRDLQRVSYLFEDGVLIRRAWLRPDPVADTPFVDRVLDDTLISVKLRYGVEGSWRLEWAPKTPSLPDLVELTLTYPDERDLTLLLLVGGGG